MKLKYIFGIFCLLIILFLSYPVKAETIIYDTIATSNYKVFRISDDVNIKYINEYDYEVYLNDSYLGNYKKDEIFFIPDSSNITIYIPKGIKTDLSSIPDIVKPSLFIIIGFFFAFGIFILIIVWIILKIWRR